ncbi:MAG: hypothetical protein HY909_30020 [Deltaproteobacteria bacterium]|nr:hypothetical protein [Deltaproteobacteria bacterium]
MTRDVTLEVPWRDATACLCVKPSGLLVHNGSFAGPRERSCTELLRAQEGASLSPVHRLDRGTSGLVLFAREGCAASWQEALGRETTDKRYLALARGYVREDTLVDHPLRDDHGALREARSLVLPLASAPEPGCTLVEVRTYTGRMHQVRRHLKHLAHPVLGDSNYGHGDLNRWYRERFGLGRLALHAWRLAVTHPFTGQRVAWRAALPEELLAPLRAIFTEAPLRELLPAPWRWPLGDGASAPPTLAPGHPGAFGATRRHDVHTGLDLYCDEDAAVLAVEDGLVVAVERFTGPAAGSPWWRDTLAVLVEGASGVVLYGELAPAEGVREGRALRAGDLVGRVRRVLARDKGLPVTMLHLELYARGAREAVWWRHGEGRPEALRDPTDALAEALTARGG